METRRSSKRGASEEPQEPATAAAPPAKRTRAAQRQAGSGAAAAPPAAPPAAGGASALAAAPKATGQRSTRGSKQAQAGGHKQSRHTPDIPTPVAAPDQQPPATQAAPSAEPPTSAPGDRQAPEAAPDGVGDMDKGNRRGSRGDAPAGSADDKDAGDVFGRNLGQAAGSALQGLLRKLGANFDDMLPLGVSGTRIKTIIQGLKQSDDDTAQLAALSDLCELLSISTEESLVTFPVDQIVPLLVQLLGAEHNPDIMLLAARALTFMADVPGLTSSIVRHGAVPAFCARLLTIEYIDLAEQSLQALEKLSHDHPGALLQAGGLMAVLSYLDFFPSSVQRTAVATAAMMCTALGPSHVSAVRDALPVLCNLLQYSDAKVVDNACMALLHVADAYAHDASLLAQLQEAGLINQALQLISAHNGGAGGGPQTSVATYFGMIRLLSTCASGSAAIVEQLLKAGVVDTLQQLLANCALLGSAGSASSGGPAIRTPDQLLEVMTLAHELLPAVPDATAMLLLDLPTTPAAAAPAAGSSGAAAGAGSAAGRASARTSTSSSNQKALADFLASDPDLVLNMCQSLLPLTLQVHSSTVMPDVRARCLGTITKLLAAGSVEQLEKVLAELPISSFVASLLSSRDLKAQAAAIQMAETLMAKLPHIFGAYFVKEGVAHALEQLASSPAGAAAAAAAGFGAAKAAAGERGGAAAAAAAPAAAAGGAGDGPRRSSSGAAGAAGLPPPSPPVTRSRRTSKADSRDDEARPGAAHPPPPPPPPAAASTAERPYTRTPSSSLRDAVARRASRIAQQHFSATGQASDLNSEALQRLRALAERLSQDDSSVAAVLDAITDNSVSVFELVTSGAISRLTAYLQGNDLPASVRKDEQLLCRLRAFTVAALAAHDQQQPMDVDGAPAAAAGGAAAAAAAAAGGVPLAALVRKLQGALASTEAFPVMCSRLVPSGGALGGAGSGRSLSRSAGLSGSFSRSTLSSGLHALTQPFKLRLVRHDTDTAVKEYPNNIVLIEPLANMTAIEDFLWPRVNRGSTLEVLRAQAAQAAAAAGGHGSGSGGGSRGAAAGAAATSAAGAATAAAAAAAAAGSGAAAAAGAAASSADGAGTTTRRRRSSSGGGSSRAGAGGHAAASKAQPIPEPDGGSGRMTRAQAARARAEAQARAEEAAAARSRARRAAAADGAGAGGGSEPMSEDHEPLSEDDLLLPGQSPGSSDDPHHAAHDGMDEDMMMEEEEDEEGFFDHEIERDSGEEDDMDDDGELDVGSMPVHDLHLADGGAAGGAAAAAAAAAAAGGGRAAVGAAAGTAAPGGAGAAAAGAAAPPAAAPATTAAAGTAGSSRAPWGGRALDGGGAAAPTAAAVVAAGAGPKLVFLMNGAPLQASATVFQAIQQSVMAGGDPYDDGAMDDGAAGVGGSGRRGQQLWDQVYTMHYRLAQPEDAAAAAAAAAAGAAGGAGAARLGGVGGRAGGAGDGGDADPDSRWRNSPLGELLAAQLPSDLAAPQSCLDILRLLHLLEVINRLAPRLLASQELQLLQAAAAAKAQAQAQATPRGDAMESSQAAAAVAVAVDQAHDGQMALAHVSRDEFVSTKLGNKLAQQLKDVLSICGGSIPAWCHQLVASCRFLFPFEVRRRYFYSTAFGLGRALHHMNQQQAAEGGGGALERDGRELRIGRLQRQKVRVSRRRILDSAVKVMEMYAKSRAVLELEYFGEVGTGLGPTLEFYTMLSHELQRRALGMWRHEEPPSADGDERPAKPEPKVEAAGGQQQQQQQRPQVAAAARAGGAAAAGAVVPVALHQEVVSHEQALAASAADYVYAPHGLFPAPLPPAQRGPGSGVVEHFRLLGRCVAKALQDNRLLDLPLNPVFLRAALGKPLDLADVAAVDPGLGASLERLARAAAAHAAAAADGGGGDAGSGPVMVDGCAVEDLCLSFTLPGDAAFPLCAGGADVLVGSANLLAYVQAVVDATLGSGIAPQLAAFREGFDEVFSLATLDVFREDEVEVLLCGAGEHWSPGQLADSMKFDHGYTSQSMPVRHLLEVLSELDPSDQRRFLRFVTGCPRLPPGGIAALQPRLTVVRKAPSLMPHGDGHTPGTTPSSNSFGDWSNGTPLADGDLPSVMTCANYIKLPPYSCKEIMRERLMFAIREGQGSFDLS